MRTIRKRPEGFPSRIQTVVSHYGSVASCAKASGVSTAAINRWLAGEVAPHPSTVRRFCEALGIRADWLLSGVGQAPEIAWERKIEPGDVHSLIAIDGQNSVLAFSASWLRSRFGVQDDGELFLVHVLPEDAIPGELDPYEPALFYRPWTGNDPYYPKPGEIILVDNGPEGFRIVKTDAKGYYQGVCMGTGLWTGRRLNRFLATRGRK